MRTESRSPRLWMSDDDLLPALLFVVLSALALLVPVQNDTFWHLRSGQEIWRTGAPLAVEPFSFTSVGLRLNDHWWLSQLAFYGLYAAGGPFLLTALTGACSLAAAVVSWRIIRGSWEMRMGLLVWMLLLVVPGWAIRPQAISLLFVALTAALIGRGRLRWLPILFVVWSNVHALVVLGVAMTGAIVMEALIWSRQELRRSLAITAMCAVAPMLSPVGLFFWPQAFQSVRLSQQLDLREYSAPLAPADFLFWASVAALVGLLVVRRSWLRRASRADRILIGAALILACAGISATRNVAVFALVGMPALSRLWAADKNWPSRRKPAPALAWVMLAASILVAATIVGQYWRDREWQSGTGVQAWKPLSPALVEAVRSCPEPTFNRLDDGGYLMWMLPERKVFVDSRINAYTTEVLHQSRAADVYGDYEEAFGLYGINCAVVGTGSPMARRLLTDPSFVRTYSDDMREVFIRR